METHETKRETSPLWTGPLAALGARLMERRSRRRAAGDLLQRALSGLRGSETVLDLGAGAGLLTLPVARAIGPEGRIQAVDHSREMLEHLTRAAGDEGLLDRVVPRQADACATYLPAASVDLVLCNNLLHEMKHPDPLLQEAARVLRPGGKLLLRDFRDGPLGRLTCALFHRGVYGPQGVEELGHRLQDAGFAEVNVERQGQRLLAAAVR